MVYEGKRQVYICYRTKCETGVWITKEGAICFIYLSGLRSGGIEDIDYNAAKAELVQ